MIEPTDSEVPRPSSVGSVEVAPGTVAPDTEVTLYRRGIDSGEVTKAVFTRFLPTSLASLTVTLGVLGVLGSPPLLEIVGVVLGSCALLSGGYWLGLSILKQWLFPDAEVTGRRSLVAGVFSPLGLISIVMMGGGAGMVAGLSLMFLTGVVMAVLMFFAWLSPTPEHLLSARYLAGGVDPDVPPQG